MIKLLFFLIFLIYMGWKGRELWKEKAKKDLVLVSGMGVMAAYLMLANHLQLPTINVLLATEDVVKPIGIWVQEIFGATLQ